MSKRSATAQLTREEMLLTLECVLPYHSFSEDKVLNLS